MDFSTEVVICSLSSKFGVCDDLTRKKGSRRGKEVCFIREISVMRAVNAASAILFCISLKLQTAANAFCKEVTCL